MQSTPSPTLSPYKIVGELVYTSGITSKSGDTPTQIRGCLEKLKTILSDAGASIDSVVKATIYLTDLSDREKYLNPIWREYFPTNPPCRTTIQVGLASGLKVEIEMVAKKKTT